MHPNPAFRQTPQDIALAFAAERGFGMLTANGPAGPLAAHVPFVIRDGAALIHLARSNPLARATLPTQALLAVQGPDSYISPDWYGPEPDQVPTWNYVAVHLRGKFETLPPETLRPMLDDLTEAFEARLAPKKPWTADKVSAEAMARLMRMILPFRLVIEGIDSTFKLNQPKTAAQRAGAIAGLSGWTQKSAREELAQMMDQIGN